MAFSVWLTVCLRCIIVLSLSGQASSRADSVRGQAKAWEDQRQRNEAKYLRKAHANRERIEKIRTRAREATGELLSSRRVAAVKERGNDHLVREEKARIFEANRREVAEVYKRRYASRKAAERWALSPLHSLQRLQRGLQTKALWFTPANSPSTSTAPKNAASAGTSATPRDVASVGSSREGSQTQTPRSRSAVYV